MTNAGLRCVGACLWVAGLLAAAAPAVAGSARVTAAREVHRDVSRPLREIVAELGPPQIEDPGQRVIPNAILDFVELHPRGAPDAAPTVGVQRAPSGIPSPLPSVSADGLRIGLGGGGAPPDPTGDVGPLHYLQWVNTSWALYSKATATLISGPTAGNSFWLGFGGYCESANDGDPLVLYDDAAQRWVLSQFAHQSALSGPFLQCVAVSTSADPLGSYYRYAFEYPIFNDYGKIGVWTSRDGGQNAYLFTMHEFSGGFQGTSFAAVERNRMLVGASAQFLRVGAAADYGALPLHQEGVHPLPDGACPAFAHFRSDGAGYLLWDLCLDWATGTADFSDTPAFIATQPFRLGLFGIPQRDSSTRLDDFGANSMYRAVIRAFGAKGPLEARAVLNHAVDVGIDRAGARWVEFGLRAPDAFAPGERLLATGFEDFPTPAPARSLQKRLIDQGTYAPGEEHRWMGGISLDASANIGLGHNVSGGTLNPQIRISGRERGDPAGQLRDEQLCTPPGTGAQTGLFLGRPRWGDYATISVDPVDQCTFWFTGEYYATTSNANWNTRLCAFRFASCGAADFELELSQHGRIGLCGSGASLELLVRPGAYGGLGGNVALGASGVPAGASALFEPTSVAMGDVSRLRLEGFGSLAPGAHDFSLSASAGALVRTRTLGVDVAETTAPAPALGSPQADATGVPARATVSWAAVAGATGYEVQLASDAAFETLLESGSGTGTRYTSQELLPVGASIHWRVRALNPCGPGAWSAGRHFSVGAPGSCPDGRQVRSVFSDNLSGDEVNWTTENAAGDPAAHWTKAIPAGIPGMPTRAWVAGNSASTADQRLATPAIVLPPAGEAPIVLGFDSHHRYQTEGDSDCRDGGRVEISNNGGTSFVPLGNPLALTDAYTGVLAGGNPLAGESAWCRQAVSGTPVRAWFLLDDYAGQTVILRFRSTADRIGTASAPAGWAIDDIAVQGCQ